MLTRFLIFFISMNLHAADWFAVDTKSFKIEWEAYKFTSRAAVKGTFNRYMAGGFHKAKSVGGLFDGVEILIDTSSVNSGVEIRDQTLGSKFFQLFSGATITAQTANYADGQVDLFVSMNGRMAVRRVPVQISDTAVSFEANFDMMKDFMLKDAWASIHEACKLLHTGPDGKAVTGTDVTVRFSADLLKL